MTPGSSTGGLRIFSWKAHFSFFYYFYLLNGRNTILVNSVLGLLLDYVTKSMLLTRVMEQTNRDTTRYVTTSFPQKLMRKKYAYGALFKYESDAKYFKTIMHKILDGVEICFSISFAETVNCFCRSTSLFDLLSIQRFNTFKWIHESGFDYSWFVL